MFYKNMQKVIDGEMAFATFEMLADIVNGKLSIHDQEVNEIVKSILDKLPLNEDYDPELDELYHSADKCIMHIAEVVGLEEFYPLIARAANVPAPSGKMDKEYAKNNISYLLNAYTEYLVYGTPWQYRLWVVYDHGRNCPETVWHCYASYAALTVEQDTAMHSAEKIFKRRHSDHHRR